MITHDEDYGFGEVPKSQGVSMSTLVIMLVGILGIMAIGYDVVHFAVYGHVWPAAQSQRIDLSSPQAR